MTNFPAIKKYCKENDKTNPVIALANQSLCGWESLISLSLSKNLLTSVPDVGFIQYQLIDLGMAFNRITSLANMCHMNYTQLNILELTDNMISHVDFSCFNMPRLKYLYLSRNLLKSITDTGMDALGEYLEPGESTIIHLSINPIHCASTWVRYKRPCKPMIIFQNSISTRDVLVHQFSMICSWWGAIAHRNGKATSWLTLVRTVQYHMVPRAPLS